MSDPGAVVEHLFRHEAGRLTALLVRVLGPGRIDEAEELVQETLATALQRWRFGELPDNPAAWLTRCARNLAIDVVRRRSTAARLERDVADAFRARAAVEHVEACFADEIGDEALRLMFSCCGPRLPAPAQVAVVLKTLSGFSVPEIAHALLVSPSAVERRISRGKAALRERGLYAIERAADLEERLGVVQRTIYLIFNEGYHGAHPDAAIRQELCGEALRLAGLLVAHPVTGTPGTHALMALLCLLAARLPARVDGEGELLALREQERARWSPELTELGFRHLGASASGEGLTPYHLEAAIAATHASAERFERTDWRRIVGLYDALVALADGPVTRLNRAIAVGQADGPVAGLEALAEVGALPAYPFLPAARAGFLEALGHVEEARESWAEATRLARSTAERRFFERRLGESRPEREG